LQSEVQTSAAKVYLWQKQQVLNDNLKQNKRIVVESIILYWSWRYFCWMYQ